MVQDFSNVAHKLACSEILDAIDAAMLRKCGVTPQPQGLRGDWLTAANVLPALAWAQSRGLTALHRKAAEYIAAHLQEISLDGRASEVGENLIAVLQSVQGKTARSVKRPRE